MFPNSANEANDVDQDTANISRIATPVEAKGKVIRGAIAGGVEIPDLVVAAADNVVVTDDDTGDRGEEDRIGG